MPIRDVIKIVSSYGGVVIPSHPFRGVNAIGEGLTGLSGICAIEGYNGCNMHNMNIKAVETAKTLGLPYTGGSDAHNPKEVGSCYTEFTNSLTNRSLVDMLKEGLYYGVDTRKISGMTF